MKRFTLALAALMISACDHAKLEEAPATNGILGQAAPEFNLDQWIDAQGKTRSPITLASLRGKIVVLEFWQSWCPGCHSQGLPTTKLIADAFKADDRVAVLGIQTVFEGHHVNTFDKLASTQKKHQLTIPMAHDPGTQASGERSVLMQAYRSGGTPWFVLIDSSGTVIYNDFHVDGPRAIEYIRSLLPAKPSQATPSSPTAPSP